MSDELALTRNEVMEIREAAQATNDRVVGAGDGCDDEACVAVMELCDLLLNGGSVEWFLRSHDMED